MSSGQFTLADLAARLAAIDDPTTTHPDGVPVVGPLTPVVMFPAILLAPDDDTLEAGARLIRSHFEVTILVARGNQFAAYVQLDAIYRAVLDRLAGSSFTFASPFRFVAGGGTVDDPSPPYMARVVPVSFVVGALCPSQPPTQLDSVENQDKESTHA